MFKLPQNRYGDYSKRKERKQNKPHSPRFLQRSYDWLNWKKVNEGGFSFYVPCLEH